MRSALVAIAILAAGSPGSFGLAATEDRPFFDYLAEPGEWISDTVLIQNQGPEPIDLKVYASAAHTTADGDWTLQRADGAAQWIIWNDDVYTVPAESALAVDFAVSVPEGTPPGEYMAGLIAEPAEFEPIDGSGGLVFSVLPQSGLAIRVVVGQPARCQVAIEGLRTIDRDLIYLDLANLGNVHFQGSGTFDLAGPGSINAWSTNLSLRHFIAFDTAPYQIQLPDLDPGPYQAEVALWSDSDPTCRAEFTTAYQVAERPEPEPEPGLLAQVFEGLRPASASDGSPVLTLDQSQIREALTKGIGIALLLLALFTALALWRFLVVYGRKRRRNQNRRPRPEVDKFTSERIDK